MLKIANPLLDLLFQTADLADTTYEYGYETLDYLQQVGISIPNTFPSEYCSVKARVGQFKLTLWVGQERHVAMGGQAKRTEVVHGHGSEKNEIGLVEAIEAVRAELTLAVAQNADKEIQFPVDKVDLEFHVGITRTASGTGGIRFWVIELGGNASHESESVHTVKVSLGAPVDSQGKTIKVTRAVSYKP
jgi:hypothetical protein